jgi:hypothetical protein
MRTCRSYVVLVVCAGLGCGGSPGSDGSVQLPDGRSVDMPRDSAVKMPDGAAGVSDGSVAVPDSAVGVPDASPDGPGHAPGTPHEGAHALSFIKFHAMDSPTVTTTPMATQPSGSTMIVGIGRGDASAFVLPTDNKSGVFQQLGTVHNYVDWTSSGTALYALPSMTGGDNYTVSATNENLGFSQYDEITLAAVEVVDGSRIQDYQWNEVLNPPYTSQSVTTTGPATLIAFWWGESAVDSKQKATPDSGFTPIDSILVGASALVECAVAFRDVTAADTYNVTWTTMPDQKAQLWLVAVQ